MNYDFIREWLSSKFEEIRTRTLQAVEQLDDDQLNWRPDETSHSISTLIRHIEGNIKERIVKGILLEEVYRNREEELTQSDRPKAELVTIVQDKLQLVIDTIRAMPDEAFSQTQTVRNRERTHLDILLQCTAHYSEHMGQIFYIAKQMLKENYKSASVQSERYDEYIQQR